MPTCVSWRSRWRARCPTTPWTWCNALRLEVRSWCRRLCPASSSLGTWGRGRAAAVRSAWLWQNYHPQKLPWALGFLAVIYVLYLAQTIGQSALRRRTTVEDMILMSLNVATWSAGWYVIFWDDYRPWLGTMAVAMALV